MHRPLARVLFAFFFVLLIAGCASAPPAKLPVSVESKSLVVVSTFGNELHLQYVGTTVFENDKKNLDVSEWKLASVIENNASAAVSKAARFKTTKVASNSTRVALRGVGLDHYHTPIYALGARKQKLQDVAKAEGSDFVLLIAPYTLKDVFFGTNQNVPDYGVYQRGTLASNPRYVVYAAVEVILYDGATGEEVTWFTNYGAKTHNGPAFPSGKMALSEDQLKATKSEMQQIIDSLLERGLREMDLVSVK